MAISPRNSTIPVVTFPEGFSSRISPYPRLHFTKLENWWPAPSDIGAIEEIPGATKVNASTVSASSDIHSIMFGEKTGQIRRRFIGYGTKLSIMDTDGTEHNIKTGLTADTEVNAVTYNSLTMFFNGVDTPFKYDFTSKTSGAVSDMGLTQPTLGSAASAVDSTPGNVRGIVKYYVAYMSTTTIGALSAVFGEIDAGDGSIIALTAIPTGGAGVTARYLYRTTDQAAVPLFLGVIADNTTTTFDDNKHDRDLGAPVLEHGGPPLDSLNFPILHFNRIWAATGSNVYFSDRGKPESWFSDNRAQLWKDDGDDITGLARDAEGIFVFKGRHIYKMVGRDPQVELFTILELTPSDQETRFVGAATHRAITSTPQGIVFYSSGSGVNIIAGGSKIVNISEEIRDELLGAINFDKENKIQLSYDPNEEILLLSVPTGSAVVNDRTYGYHMTRKAWFRMSYGFADMQSVEGGTDGQPVGALSMWASDPTKDGFVLKIFDNTVNQYDGANITTEALFGTFFTRTPGHDSRFQHFDNLFRAQTGSLTVGYKIDGQTTATTASVSMASAGFGTAVKRINVGQQGRELTISYASAANQDRALVHGLNVVVQHLGSHSR